MSSASGVIVPPARVGTAAAMLVLAAGCSGSAPEPPPADRHQQQALAEQDPETPAVRCREGYPAFAACRDHILDRVAEGDAAVVLATFASWRRERPGLEQDPGAEYLAGWTRYMTRDPQEIALAREHFARTVALARRRSAPAMEARARLMIGAIADFVDGEAEAAMVHYEAAADLAAGAGDSEGRLQAAWSVSTLHRRAGRTADEIRWLRIASESDPDPETARSLLYAIAASYQLLGDHQAALRHANELIDAAQQAGDAHHEALALQLVAVVTSQNDPASAIPWYERSREAADRAGEGWLVSHLDVLVGFALLQAGDREAAREHLERTLPTALDYAERYFEWRDQGVVNLTFLAEALAPVDPGRAEELYLRAHDRASEWEKPDYRWQSSAGLAHLYASQDRLDEALAVARRSLDEIEALRGSLPDEGHRRYFLHKRSDAFATMASVLHRRGAGPAAVLRVLERVHARTLRESLAGRRDAEIAVVDHEALRRRLGPGDLLVAYLLGESGSLLVSMTGAGSQIHELPPRREIETAVARYRQALQRPLTAVDARTDPRSDFLRFAGDGHALYELVLGPVEQRLASARRLIVVPDKQLHRLPFGALVTELSEGGRPRFLAAAVGVAYLPAASLLAPGPPPTRGDLLLVDAAVATPALDLAPLSRAGDEVRGVVAAYGDRSEVVGPEALDAAAVLRALERRPDVLHVVGHTVPDPSAGPRIVLGPGAEGPRFLGTADILGLDPAPPLVVLSACDTAEGELVGGEGLLGLVRAFRLAGTRDVVATLWKVDDATAADLMKRFHHALADGRSPADALAGAKQALLAGDFVHPFYWSPFVLLGSGG